MSDEEDGVVDPAEFQDPEEVEDQRSPPPGLPTIDHEEPPPRVDYRDWSPETTKVVSGPLGPVKQYPGRRFMSWRAARAYWLERAGRIIEDLSVHGRYIYRVRRDA